MFRALTTLAFVGCVQGDLSQTVGDGANYETRCSSEMEVRGVEYFAQCTPSSCGEGYTSGPVSSVVVAIDPGKKIIGYATRVCVQDSTHMTEFVSTPTDKSERD